jgi:hypothetical protein
LQSFITNQPREESISALSFCRFFVISKTKFNEVINQFPEEKEKFFEYSYKAAYEDDYTKICYSCGATDHTLKKCKDIHYIPKEENL